MSEDFLERISKMSPKRLALLAVQLKEELDATKARAPLAIIGMACRFPGGADDPRRYWELLAEGRDAIREVPADRWDIDAFFDPDPDAPARMSARAGGFLDRIDGFDPPFFSITPREAQTMDPQQRLLLEVSWEALEHAGVAPAALLGSPTGVFIGVCNSDHFQRVLGRGMEEIDAYLASGNAHSVAAGRISYFLGLQGPALAIDTACSSSLVALHVACQSLRSGESRIAIAGGVNVMCSPETTVALTKAHMLAPDGRCKTFSAAADGFSRGEGCGVLVLKRLADAVADGDRVLALVRGTASNQDGRSGGLTVPNGPAQEAVIRAALADAGLSPADIDYVEAHGTGTTLGDPIEVKALAGALGPGRRDPLLIGSVKTNFGHLESAAGVAGVMKVVLSLMHERIPRHLHFAQPSPHIAWAEYPVSVTADGRDWPRGPRRRLAGVSSFGFSGTNAHVILEEAPAPSTNAPALALAIERPLHCLPLSARTGEALTELAGSAERALEQADINLADAAHTAGVGRSHFSERLAVVAGDATEARAALGAARNGAPHPALHRGVAVAGSTPEVVFLYTGQGSQYPGMGRLLYDTLPVYREIIDKCDAALGADASGRTLKSVLAPGPTEGAPIHETTWTQPALFALEYALTQVWRSWGVEPAAVIGHSVGEYVAACVAGVFTMEEGLRLIAERGRLMQALPPGGMMAAIFAPRAEVEAAVATMPDRVAIAAVNAPDSVVISGESAGVEALLASFAQQNVQGHKLFVGLAGHSPLVEPALPAMEAASRAVTMRAPNIPVAWNVTGGDPLPGGAPDAVYWRRHLREPVRFADGIASLHRQGYRTFLEVGPHPVLMALAQRSLPGAEQGTWFHTSLRRGKDDWAELYASLADLYVHGAPVDWAGVDRPYARRRVTWPSYPFQRKRFWITPGGGARRAPAARGGQLVGERLPTATPVWQTTLSPASAHYLAEHHVGGAVLVAGPVFLELAQAAARELHGPALRAVRGFAVREALVLPDEGRTVETHLTEAPDGTLAFSIHSRAADGTGEWLQHASGQLVRPGALTAAAAPTDVGPAADCAAYYERLADLGIELGPSFRSLAEARRRDGAVLATVALAPACEDDPVTWAHPALLDGALQAVGLAVPASAGGGDVYLLSEIDHIELVAPLPARFSCHARLHAADGSTRAGPAEWRADVTLAAPDGTIIGALGGVCLRRASREALARFGSAPAAEGIHYRVNWEPAPLAPAPAAALVDPASFGPRIAERFSALAATNDLSIYEQLLPELDRLSADYAAAALQRLGFAATPGRVFAVADEAARLGVVERHARLFRRMLEILAEDGMLRARAPGYEVAAPLPTPDPAARAQALLARFSATDGELSTLRRCGPELARVLRGEQDPLQLLFPGGSFAEARKLYIESPYARTYNSALGEALEAALARLPAGARLRVLEIGAGTGGTTTYALPRLPADRTEYTFTDLSPLFLERAATEFAAYPFVKRALLDIERDPVTQGFEAGAYDVVIAANVLHATADLRQAVLHARKLLASGGVLLLLEGVAPERWVDLTFGLTEGWWRFTDTGLRPAYPLVGRQAWLDLLAELGFTGGAAIPDGTTRSRAGSQQAFIVARAPARRRRFTLVGAGGLLGAALARRLEAQGDRVTLLPADAPADSLVPADEIVYLGALDLVAQAADDATAVRRAEALACELPLEWLARVVRGADLGRVWLVTQGAQPAANDLDGHPGRVPMPSRDGTRRAELAGTPRDLAPGAAWQAPLWGLGRVFALEQPGRWGGLVDLPPEGTPESLAETLVGALDGGEDQTAWRAGARLAARLVPAATPEAARVSFRADATYLVTGGFGGLGLIVARWMAERGARHLALLGRRPDPTAEGVRAIEALGARVIPLAGDVADEAAMAAAFSKLREGPPLRGIIHAAADFSVGAIDALAPAQVAGMLRPKIAGTVLLDRLAGPELDFFALFSSTTALLGAAGFAHYAAANAFLDAFAHGARARGRRVLSVNWGTWEAMRLASAESQRSYREGGLIPMPASEALEALGRLLGGDEAQAVVARVDWSVLKPLHEARRARPFLSRLALVPASSPRTAGNGAGTPADLPARLAGAPADTRRELIVSFVRDEVAVVLGVGGGALALDTGLFDLGMDSLMSVELKKRLERGAGRPLPATLTFNYPNVNALATFLDGELAPAPAAAPAPTPPTTPEPPLPSGDLAGLSEDELEARLLARLERMR
jgi:acyl transferase domain-containing protein/NADP-dependent 3-hydroxy acid dehydrogenase YdfG